MHCKSACTISSRTWHTLPTMVGYKSKKLIRVPYFVGIIVSTLSLCNFLSFDLILKWSPVADISLRVVELAILCKLMKQGGRSRGWSTAISALQCLFDFFYFCQSFVVLDVQLLLIVLPRHQSRRWQLDSQGYYKYIYNFPTSWPNISQNWSQIPTYTQTHSKWHGITRKYMGAHGQNFVHTYNLIYTNKEQQKN